MRPRFLARKLKRIRLDLDLTQKELLHALGCDHLLNQSHISAYERERNNRIPPPFVLLRYARLVGLPMEILVDDELELPDRRLKVVISVLNP